MLSENAVADSPVAQLRSWVEDARQAGAADLLEVVLATVDANGDADARVVIVREIGERGLTFYSDTRSRKGVQLRAGGRGAMVAYWPALSRQVRLRGEVELLPDGEIDAAFAARPRRSQLGYWANHQSRPVADRAALVAQLADTERRFEGREIPRPEHFAVWALRPDFVEFWQSGEQYLHDRVAYSRAGDGWEIERLQP